MKINLDFLTKKRIKMSVALLLSFGIVAFLSPFVFYPNSPSLFWNKQKISNQIATISQNTKRAVSTLAALVPATNSFISQSQLGFSETVSPTSNPMFIEVPGTKTVSPTSKPGIITFFFPKIPTKSNKQETINPTSSGTGQYPTSLGAGNKQPTINNQKPTTTNQQPTNNQQPTTKPKPTKKLKPTPTPQLVLEARRPGNNFAEVIKILSPIMCVPEPLLWGTLIMEYGTWMNNVERYWEQRNTYPGQQEPGATAANVMSMIPETWAKVEPVVRQKFNTNAPLSDVVVFDSMAVAAYHLRNISLAMKNKIACDDWPVQYILYAACRYNGACPANTFGDSRYYNDYTKKVCNYYNQYTKGNKKNCQ